MTRIDELIKVLEEKMTHLIRQPMSLDEAIKSRNENRILGAIKYCDKVIEGQTMKILRCGAPYPYDYDRTGKEFLTREQEANMAEYFRSVE